MGLIIYLLVFGSILVVFLMIFLILNRIWKKHYREDRQYLKSKNFEIKHDPNPEHLIVLINGLLGNSEHGLRV